MATKLSRRSIANYVARQLAGGTPKVKKHTIELLAAYLVDTGRTSELMAILRDIEAALVTIGHAHVTVTSAHELSDATLKAIKNYTTTKTGAPKVSLETVIDESVLGGVKLELPGRQLDATIKHQLATLKHDIKKA